MMLFNKSLSCLLLLAVIAITLLPEKSDAGCACALGGGTDVCSGCSGRRVVRPKPKPHESNPDIDLSPIGDKCWCTKKMIEPAVLPKIVEKKKPCGCGKPVCTCEKPCGCGKPPKTCGCQKSYSSESSLFSNVGTSSTYMAPQPTYSHKPVNHDESLPADPISVSLAIQAGKAIEVPEAKLSYGYVQKPIESLPKVFISSVKEENLYALKNDVITLKKTQPARKKHDDEYPEVEEEEHPKDDGAGASDDEEKPTLTYKQLGYITENYKNPQFENVESSYAPTPSEPAVVNGYVSVDCGYRPGRIATMRRPKHNSYY